MRRGGVILILLGIILGLVTAVGTFITISQQPQPQPAPTRPIVVALQNIPGRTEILPEAVGLQSWPEGSIPPGAIERTDDVIGKLAVDPIYQGQLFLPPMIIDKTKVKETRSNASFLIPDGQVAVAFSAGGVNGVAGALQPGDTVDIMLTLNPSGLSQGAAAGRTTTTATATTGTEGEPVTQLMLQDVLILQVGSWAAAGSQQGGGGSGDTLTIVLSRQDALALKSALEQGSFQLALRPAGDHKPATTEPVTLQYLNKRFNFNLR